MAYYELEAVPHFIVKTSADAQDMRKELLQEYGNFLRFLLLSHRSVTMWFRSVTVASAIAELQRHTQGCEQAPHCGRCAQLPRLSLAVAKGDITPQQVQRVQAGYEIPQEHRDLTEYLNAIRRYIRLTRAMPPGDDDVTDTRLTRRVQLMAVGTLDGAHTKTQLELLSPSDKPFINLNPRIIGQSNFMMVGVAPLLNLFGGAVRTTLASRVGQAYLMPLPDPVKVDVDTSRWRHTLSTLLRSPGSISLACSRHQRTDEDARYALLCLDYYIGTNSEKLNAQQIDTDTAIHRTIYSNQPIWTLDVKLHGKSAPLLAQALGRDTDSRAFENSPNELEYQTRRARPTTEDMSRVATPRPRSTDSLRLSGAGLSRPTTAPSPETLARVAETGVHEHPAAKYGRFFLIDELVGVLTPPYTFKDALPGLPHFVPKPFQEPSVPEDGSTDAIVIGRAENQREVTLPIGCLTRHTFITGASGAGKSNTMMNIVRQLTTRRVPVLIIDPVKRDFEPLMKSIGLEDHIWDFDRRWLRFNPFIPAPNITLYSHSVILAKTFAMLFPTNAVAYEIILGMVKEAYLQKLNAGQKPGVPPLTTEAFVKITGRTLRKFPGLAPTFAEFLQTGLKSLRASGGDGRPSQWLLDALEHFERRWANIRRSVFSIMLTPKRRNETIDHLFGEVATPGAESPAPATHLVEFGAWFDQSEANAAFALIFSMMYERRLSDAQDAAAEGRSPSTHVALLDEAHRIVPAHVAGGDERLMSAAKEASSLLTQMIAECRALGQGLILAEQSASKIDPNVLINTSTKIIHTVLYGKDKEFLSSALSLSAAEQDYLAYLPVGEALLFASGVYQPMYVNIPEFREIPPQAVTATVA